MIRVAILALLISATFILVGGLPLIRPLATHAGITRNSYLRHYEPVWYDAVTLRQHRARFRRDTDARDSDQALIMQMRVLDKQWTVRLVRDSGLFAEDAVFENNDGPINFDKRHLYTGSILEDDRATVQGIVTEDGLLDGTISTQIEDIHIEPVGRYLGPNDTYSPIYHTIAYRLSDVQVPKHPKNCSGHNLRRGIVLNADSKNDPNPYFEYLPAYNDLQTNILDSEPSTTENRYKRHIDKRAVVDSRKTTCMLYLQADHLFFARYGTEEACIEVMTRHVQKANSIYRHTDFDQDGRPDNITFMIKRVKVYTSDAIKDPHYRFAGRHSVEKFLELFSEEDYDAFCLSYMFTYRDFEMGTLGLAWTGDLKNAGGVCERNGHYRGSMKSLNTGIVTLLNYGKHVPPAVSHVTLAHEIGHNFGSPHDPEQCTPGGEDGNYIMFARATSGDKRNNKRFSQCSLNAIKPVLNAKARSIKGCFTEPQMSLCGNGVVEDGEECDCGWEEDCRDSCCFPQRRYPANDEIPCTLTPGSLCSPSQGPCCKNDCKLRFGDKCRDDNGCRDASFCDGRSPYCPPSINKPNKTICNQELVCFMGECTGSICLAYGLESCQCVASDEDPPTKACELCCRLPGENHPCLSSFDWNLPPYDIPDMFSKPGTPCNDYNGYCDMFQRCRDVDPRGPLASLSKFLLSDESLASFQTWIVEHWYVVVLTVMGAVCLLLLTAKIMIKKPEKKLKPVTIMHSSKTETVRLPPEGSEGVTVHPPAVREKLPLNKKVREKRKKRSKKSTKDLKNRDKKKRKCFQKSVSANPVGATANPLPTIEEVPRRRSLEIAATFQIEEKPKHELFKKRKSKKISKKSSKPDPRSKVRSWLLSSHCRTVEPLKSPGASKNIDAGQPVFQRTSRHSTPQESSGKSRNPLSQFLPPSDRRTKVQVLYKPPFRFSVRLRKAEKAGTRQQTKNRTRKRGMSEPKFGTEVGKSVNEIEKTKKSRSLVDMIKRTETTFISEPENSDVYKVPSDLEVLLSESEFLFADAT